MLTELAGDAVEVVFVAANVRNGSKADIGRNPFLVTLNLFQSPLRRCTPPFIMMDAETSSA